MKKNDTQLIDLSTIINDINQLECPQHHVKGTAYTESNRIIAYGCCRSFTDHLSYVCNSKIEAMIKERLNEATEVV